ncbi:phytochrome A, partial [Prunus dulcis]
LGDSFKVLYCGLPLFLAIGTIALSASALHKTLGFGETSGKPFYAITHRLTGSLIIDFFEPVKPYEVPMTALLLGPCSHTSLQLKQLPDCSLCLVERLCDTMVQEVFELTGYDTVMTAYKFHDDDDHGEVVSEITKPGLEPYLGLHYPSTDIPQASRFLFMKNKVRMIVDCCCAKQVKVLQDEKLPVDLALCGSSSTLRAPHSCHPQYMKN